MLGFVFTYSWKGGVHIRGLEKNSGKVVEKLRKVTEIAVSGTCEFLLEETYKIHKYCHSTTLVYILSCFSHFFPEKISI